MNEQQRDYIYLMATLPKDGNLDAEAFPTFEELRKQFFATVAEAIDESDASPEEIVDMVEEFDDLWNCGVIVNAYQLSIADLRRKQYTIHDLLNGEE